ncbi:DUF6473 family protein [Pseudodonghicola flavimaris]|uniref:DUF6473 family protein n=1 Tax=Pseudodonghicola flavimaris TaxID=3050036 RepID=A0ABT7F6G8_9RHOB|nr:DUF6473 family protein [Pseudodonghicola flavimaris]MDK3020208.1 DUF6473 family protein [Pseudodonghicola flavimaris]
MSFITSGAGAREEEVCRYPGSNLWFRAPCAPLDEPYIAFLGGSETFGRFVPDPFPDLVDRRLGRPCLNLGCANAGLDTLLKDPGLMRIAAAADLVVLQLSGAQNLSNRYYRVHPRRNDRFLAPTPKLAALYPEVDFTEFHFTKHLLTTLLGLGPDRFAAIREELRHLWMKRMSRLLAVLEGQVLLLWLQYPDAGSRRGDPLGADPLLVSRSMIDRAARQSLGVLEVPVAPASLRAGEMGRMVFGPLQAPTAEKMLGPEMHQRIAGQVAQRLQRLL